MKWQRLLHGCLPSVLFITLSRVGVDERTVCNYSCTKTITKLSKREKVLGIYYESPAPYPKIGIYFTISITLIKLSKLNIWLLLLSFYYYGVAAAIAYLYFPEALLPNVRLKHGSYRPSVIRICTCVVAKIKCITGSCKTRHIQPLIQTFLNEPIVFFFVYAIKTSYLEKYLDVGTQALNI